MPQFKLLKSKQINRKRSVMTMAIVIALMASYSAYNALSQGEILKTVTISLAFVSWLIFYDDMLKKSIEGNARRLNYLLSIDETKIQRTISGESTIIEKHAITSVVKERSGGIRINGNDGIYIPQDIENYLEAEEALIKFMPPHLLDNNSAIPLEPSESIFQVLAEITANYTNVTLLTIAIIVLSYLKIMSYYQQFDIDINSYLDPAEAILSFGSQWKEILVVLICMLALHKVLGYVRIKVPNREDSFANRLKTIWAFVLWSGATISLFVIFDSFLSSSTNVKSVEELVVHQSLYIVPIIMIIFSLAIVLVTGSLLIWHRPKMLTTKYTILATLLIAAMITYSENIIGYRSVISGYGKYEVDLTLNNEKSFKTGTTMIFIGSTNNYYFFQDIKSNANLIIPKASVLKERSRLIRIGI